MVLLVALLASALVGSAHAADNTALSNRRLHASRAATPPEIDGNLSDGAWQQAAKAETFSDSFNFNTEIDQTEAWLCYDDQAIYVAFHCRDSQPEQVVGREIRRDASFNGEDTVAFILDPFHSRRGDDSNYFTTNALGTPSSYIAGGRATKTEWKGEWSSAARRTEDGWTAEMRIPWRIVTFPARAGPATMGLNFRRNQERTKIVSYWSNLGPQYLNELAGDWEEVILPKGAFKRNLSLLPYTVSGYNVGRGTAFGSGFGRGKMFNAGLDARMALTPELTAVGTLNPDFSTVERAVEGIDFTRGERFVPDTRPFFLEGGQLFDVSVRSGRGWGEAFFSGRIPAFDAGAKLYGRVGPRDSVGVFGAVNSEAERGDFVGRWTRDIAPGSFVGGYVVEREMPGDRNTVLGVNESLRRGAWQLRSDYAQSLGDEAGGGAAAGGVRWNGRHMGFGANYTYVHPQFRAANGFVQFTDFRGPDLFTYYYTEWRGGPLRSLNLYASGLDHNRTDGSFFRRQLQGGGSVETRGDWRAIWRWEGGQFKDEQDSEYTLGLTRNVSNRYNRVGLSYSFGTRANEPIRFVQPVVSRRLFGAWDVSVSSSLLEHEGSRSLHVITLNREFDRYRALGGRVLVRDGYLHYFLSYRISGGRGMESYFLIGDPVARAKTSRTRIILKFVYPVAL